MATHPRPARSTHPILSKGTQSRTIHAPYTPATTRPTVCPICSIAEHLCESGESRRRDVSGDRWALTPLGQALLDGLRALEHGSGGDGKGGAA